MADVEVDRNTGEQYDTEKIRRECRSLLSDVYVHHSLLTSMYVYVISWMLAGLGSSKRGLYPHGLALPDLVTIP